MSWFDDAANGRELDIAAMFDSGVPGLIAEVVAAGALVSVGRTSDGGAVGITITLDGKYRREYFRDSDEMTSYLIEARDAVVAEAERASASPGRGKRSRRS